jgi:ubiquinone/menaquinone biosynthesis C-methylase UbiE
VSSGAVPRGLPPDAARVRRFYDEVWTRYLQDQEEAERHLREILPAELVEGRDALDGGCGGGAFARALARAGARSVTGLDISLGSLGTARTVNATERLAHVCGSMERLPFRDGQFGVVWAWGSVEHTVHPWIVLGELDRVLAPGGRIMVALYKKTWLAPVHGVARAALSSLPRRTHAPLSKALAILLAPFVLIFRRRQKMRKGETMAGLVHDWFFVPLRHHFDPAEVREWFAARGYAEELFIPSTARFESSSHFILRMRKGSGRTAQGLSCAFAKHGG